MTVCRQRTVTPVGRHRSTDEAPPPGATVDEQLRDETTTDEQLSDAETIDGAPPPGPQLTSLCRKHTWRMSKGNATRILGPSQATNLLTNMADEDGHQPHLLAPAINLLTDIADGDVKEESYLLEGHTARLLAPAQSYYTPQALALRGRQATRVWSSVPRHTWPRPRKPSSRKSR